MYKKVLLTQFCIPNLDTLEYKSNVHLAPGYLVGYAKGRLPKTEFVITPRVYTDLLNETAFIEYALNQNNNTYQIIIDFEDPPRLSWFKIVPKLSHDQTNYI